MDAIPVNTVSGIGSGEASSRAGLKTKKAIAVTPPTGSPGEDIVALSPMGIALSRADAQSRLRIIRISEFRAEIKAGTFVTPERVDGTILKLLKILG